MPKVIETNDDYVTLGVVDKGLTPHMELRSVTFTDVFGTPHTVHAHKEGPFNDPQAIIDAWEDGVLHAFDSHEKASAYERDRGNTEHAERLAKLAGSHDQPNQRNQEGGY